MTTTITLTKDMLDFAATTQDKATWGILVSKEHGIVITDGHILLAYPSSYSGRDRVLRVAGKITKSDTLYVDVDKLVEGEDSDVKVITRNGRPKYVSIHCLSGDVYLDLGSILSDIERSLYTSVFTANTELMSKMAGYSGEFSLTQSMTMGVKGPIDPVRVCFNNGVHGVLMPMRVDQPRKPKKKGEEPEAPTLEQVMHTRVTPGADYNELVRLKQMNIELRFRARVASEYACVAMGAGERCTAQQREAVHAIKDRMEREFRNLSKLKHEANRARLEQDMQSLDESILQPSVFLAASEGDTLDQRDATDALHRMAEAARNGMSGADYADESMNILVELGHDIGDPTEYVEEDDREVGAVRPMTEAELHETDEESDERDWAGEPEPMSTSSAMDLVLGPNS